MDIKKMTIPAKILKEIQNIALGISGKQRNDFTEENIVLSVYGRDVKMQPRVCANICANEYGCNITGNDVIRIFKQSNLGNVPERERLFTRASRISAEIMEYICNGESNIESVGAVLDAPGIHPHFRRIVLLYFFDKAEQLRDSAEKRLILRLNRDFAGECLESILIFAKSEYLFNKGRKIEKNRSIEEYEREIYRLDANLKRVNDMLIRVQDEFDERLEESRREEHEKFISLLNSPEYGYILDLLMATQQGFRQLRAQKIDVPFEINAAPTLVRKLLQFVEDSGISPIMEYGSRAEIKLSDIEGSTYEGSYFGNENEIKKVTVISPGWEIKDKGTIISNPILREIEEEKC